MHGTTHKQSKARKGIQKDSRKESKIKIKTQQFFKKV